MQDMRHRSSESVFNDGNLRRSGPKTESWTISSIFLAAFLFRILLVFYARIHDYFFKISFTDVDYKVFSDAAKFLYSGDSPFSRPTYRYSPILAWFLIPNVIWPDFGKILFCTLDIVVGWLCYKVAQKSVSISGKSVSKKAVEQAWKGVLVFWLINPLTAVISARGNADVLVCASVVSTLYLIINGKWFFAAVLHGLAVHLKLYPIVYLPSIFLYLSLLKRQSGFLSCLKCLLLNGKGFAFVLGSLATFSGLIYSCYYFYGLGYLNEALLYHITRTDTRHNFSPYFYLFYLANEDLKLSRLVGVGAFLPQAALVIYFAFRYHKDLPFCWLITTISFVSFNKVCTSQYFIWYICLIPAAQRTIQLPQKRIFVLILVWFLGQASWLLPAYLFEFEGYNTFVSMWLASLIFLGINACIIVQLCIHHSEPDEVLEKNLRKKIQ